MSPLRLGIAAQLVPQGELEIVPTTLAAPVHPDSEALYAYWRGRQDHGGLKLGRDLPARGIARLMANISVLEPVEGTSDFEFHIAGSGWISRFGRDIQGERLSRLYSGDTLDHYVGGLREVLDSGRPHFVDVRAGDKYRELFHIEYAQFPVRASNSDRLCVLAGAFHF